MGFDATELQVDATKAWIMTQLSSHPIANQLYDKVKYVLGAGAHDFEGVCFQTDCVATLEARGGVREGGHPD